MKFDVILYFCGVHTSHVQKYINLSNEIQKKHSALLMLDNGKWGCKNELLEKFRHYNGVERVKLVTPGEAIQILNTADYKLGIFSSNYRKGHVGNSDILACRARGAKSLQLSEMPVDFYYAGSDYVSLISKEIESMISNKFKNYGNSKVIYSNCFLWDVVSPNSNLENKDLFFEKYCLQKDRPFFIWTPDSIQCQHQEAQEVYEEVCKLDNVIVKLHPNEVRRHKAERVNFKWSYDLYTSNKVRVLESQDTHYAYRYCDAIISYQSSIGWEIPAYEKPVIYINKNSENNLLFNSTSSNFYNKQFDFVGHECDLVNLESFIREQKYLLNNDYQDYKDIYLKESGKNSYEIISEQVTEILNGKI
jgi:hypothetical protein